MSSTRSRLAIALLGMAGGVLGAARSAAQERVFPPVRSFERPQASPRVDGVVGRLLSVQDGDSRFGGGREAEVALGENFPVLAFGSGPVTLGFGTEVYGRFSLDDSRTSLISNDWVVEINATADLGRWAVTAALSHESSHLGDEYEDRFHEPRVDWSRETLTAWVSYTAGHWRVSTAVSQVLIDQLGLERQGGALGLDYRGAGIRLLGGTVRPIAGLFHEANAATRWRVSTSARLGLALSGPETGADVDTETGVAASAGRRQVAISLIAHDGLSTQRQFFRRTSRYIGLELRFDL